MNLRIRLTALAAVILSATGVGATTPAAEAAPIIGARECTTAERWSFSPPLTITPALLNGNATQDYDATCIRAEVDPFTPPYLFTSAGSYDYGGLGYRYVGDCVAAVLLRTGLNSPGAGVLVGGVVGVVYGGGGTASATFHNVSVKVLLPDPGSDICSESSASGLGVTVGTLP